MVRPFKKNGGASEWKFYRDSTGRWRWRRFVKGRWVRSTNGWNFRADCVEAARKLGYPG